jgi:cytochrome P450
MNQAHESNSSFMPQSGPRGLPFLGNFLQINRKTLHRDLANWCDTYGPSFQFKIANKSFVVISDADLIQQLLKKRPDGFRRMRSIETVFAEMSNRGVFSAEGDAWKRQRKLIMPAFYAGHLSEFYKTLSTVTQRLRRRWMKFAEKGEDIEVVEELMRFTVDVTTLLAFDYDINTIETDGDIIQKSLEEIFPTVARRVNAPFPYWRYLRLPADRAFDQALARIKEKVSEMVALHRKRVAADPEIAKRPSNNSGSTS